MSTLGWFNFLLVQWTFYRLAKTVELGTCKPMGYCMLGPVWPLTGWWSNYVWLGKRR